MKQPWFKTAGGLLALALAVRLLLLPTWPLMDPTEGRYAELARQIVLTGNWLTPHVWVDGFLIPFLGKPPLHFWISALCMKSLGVHEFAARLPSWLGALAALGAVWAVGRRYFGPQAGALTALVTLTSGLFFALSGIVGVDMVLAAGVTLAYFSYFAWTQEPAGRTRFLWSLGVFVGLGFGFMTKGPVALATYGMPIVAWHLVFGRWQELRHHAWLTGGLLFLAIVVPWFWLAEKADPGFCKYFFVEENLHRFTTKNYYDPYGSGKVVPHGTSILYMLAAVLPWPLLLPRLFKGAGQERWSWRRNPLWHTPAQAFFFLGFAVNTLFWCLATQYMITYMLPLVPMFAAWLVLVQQERWPEAEARILWIARAVVALMAVVFLGLGLVFQRSCAKSMKRLVADVASQAAAQGFPARIWATDDWYTLYFYGDQAGQLQMDKTPGTVLIDADARIREFPYMKRGDYDGSYHKEDRTTANRVSSVARQALVSGQDVLVLWSVDDMGEEKEFLGPRPAPKPSSFKEKFGMLDMDDSPAGMPPNPPWDKLVSIENPVVKDRNRRPWALRPAEPGESPDFVFALRSSRWLLYRTCPKPAPAASR